MVSWTAHNMTIKDTSIASTKRSASAGGQHACPYPQACYTPGAPDPHHVLTATAQFDRRTGRCVSIRPTVTGDLVHVSQPTVCRTVRTVTTLIARVLFRRLVHFPAASEYHGVMRDFHAMGQFPGVTGYIDCTHVRIRSPGGEDAEVYRNRKRVFSLNVQAITGPQLQFFDVVASWPGSVHDSRIFDGSRARALYEESRVPGVLLGDMGYACLPFLMTPLENPGATNSPGRRYNKAQIRTRNSVERAFGVWKRRFPCLDMRLQHKTRHSCSIITACAALHNLGRARNEPLPPPPPPPPSPRARNARRRRQPHLPPILPEDSPSGLRIRQNIILLSFT
ncbi:hypothetical protein HPB47_015331 [Ixodes persulcatus]|uniref:Uncharacterized protein n=1 Tax=Ixodes persulcatus TaxID=34615 RepID=A0AC60R192_IXOPE|nr:hypothetical protein HPB47_015331 [Ixodes persulcatus]